MGLSLHTHTHTPRYQRTHTCMYMYTCTHMHICIHVYHSMCVCVWGVTCSRPFRGYECPPLVALGRPISAFLFCLPSSICASPIILMITARARACVRFMLSADVYTFPSSSWLAHTEYAHAHTHLYIHMPMHICLYTHMYTCMCMCVRVLRALCVLRLSGSGAVSCAARAECGLPMVSPYAPPPPPVLR